MTNLSSRDFPRLEKKRVIDAMLTTVFGYSKWDEVLRHYGSTPIHLASPESLEQEARLSIFRSGGGGESEAHRRVKEFIASHPELLSLPATSVAEIEHPFPSADCIDVLFRIKDEWVGVEVKGPNSDELDLNRGLFQCVKYQALLEAEQRLLQQGVNCRVILAICRPLPEPLKVRRLVLNIDVRELNVPTV